ncbi:MAG: DNA cytosine methyltransferase [Planctomycetia bacterium]|nr:DNA cytosine methyltransferase [Planctomycetia bacterium]
MNPRAVMLENVRGFLAPVFNEYRENILNHIASLGYKVQIKLLNADDYGVPQLRPRIVIVGIRNDISKEFHYPEEPPELAPTVGETLYDLNKSNGWKGANSSCRMASFILATV